MNRRGSRAVRGGESPLLAMSKSRKGTDFRHRASAAVTRRGFVDLGRDTRHTVFLAGSPRSGTTWLAELINHDNRYRTIFEPFRPDRVPLTRSFHSRQYLRPSSDDPVITAPIDRILAGRVRNRWTDQYNRRMLATHRLIKDPWSNLFLGWISGRHPQMPIVLVVRHPCAVVSSQIAMGAWKWHVDLEDVLSQQDLVEDHLGPYLGVVASASTLFERHVALWCIENLVAIRQLEGQHAHVLFYEDLVLDPVSELERLFDFLGRPHAPAVASVAPQPSALTRKDSPLVLGESPIDGWRKAVDGHEVRRATELIVGFGLDGLYSSDPLPVRTRT